MKDPRKRRSQRQEKRLTKKVGGRMSPGSGSGERPNDVRTDHLLIEAKCRVKPDAKQITIKLNDLRQVERNAAAEGRVPILSFELGGYDYYILHQADIEHLL